MSHFDDLDFDGPTFIPDGPGGAIFVVLLVALFLAGAYWAASADTEAEQLCIQHGEKYVDSRVRYTLCEREGGIVVRRGGDRERASEW